MDRRNFGRLEIKTRFHGMAYVKTAPMTSLQTFVEEKKHERYLLELIPSWCMRIQKRYRVLNITIKHYDRRYKTIIIVKDTQYLISTYAHFFIHSSISDVYCFPHGIPYIGSYINLHIYIDPKYSHIRLRYPCVHLKVGTIKPRCLCSSYYVGWW